MHVSSIATVSSDINSLSISVETPKRSPNNTPNTDPALSRGGCLDTEDRERIRAFVEQFTKSVLVPFVERQLVTQNEALMNRRGIGKSFTNMKKWLNVASVTPQSPGNSANVR
jgi:hypothetical protein